LPSVSAREKDNKEGWIDDLGKEGAAGYEGLQAVQMTILLKRG
jgi:hypothetical protein